MERLTWMLAGMLRNAMRLLPDGRRQWAEAVQAEAGQVPAGWPRLRWLAGGLWLVAREGTIVRKVVYWLGVGAVAAAAAWVGLLSWQASPATDPQAVTDRVRILAVAAALAGLPWVGRRRGLFGPVGSSLTARLVRVAGCVAVCGLGAALVRMDSHLGLGPHGPGPFSLPREIAALVLLGVALAARAVGKARWPDAEALALWAVPVSAGMIIFITVPLQTLAVLYVAGILAATSRRSPITTASLGVGTITGMAMALAAGLAVHADIPDRYAGFLLTGLLVMVLLFAAFAGLAAAWLLSGTEDPQELRMARTRQGLFAGLAAGAVCGLLATDFFAAAVFMMVIGPIVGAAAGGIGGEIAASHPRRPRPTRSWAAGLFISH